MYEMNSTKFYLQTMSIHYSVSVLIKWSHSCSQRKILLLGIAENIKALLDVTFILQMGKIYFFNG